MCYNDEQITQIGKVHLIAVEKFFYIVFMLLKKLPNTISFQMPFKNGGLGKEMEVIQKRRIGALCIFKVKSIQTSFFHIDIPWGKVGVVKREIHLFIGIRIQNIAYTVYDRSCLKSLQVINLLTEQA